MRQMQVIVAYLAIVDGFPQVSVCLVRHTNSDAVYSNQFGIDLGTGGSACPDIYLERGLFHAFCEFMHCNFRIAAWRKSGNTDDVPCIDHSCSCCAWHDLGEKALVLNPAKEFTIIGVDHYYHPPKNKIIYKSPQLDLPAFAADLFTSVKNTVYTRRECFLLFIENVR